MGTINVVFLKYSALLFQVHVSKVAQMHTKCIRINTRNKNQVFLRGFKWYDELSKQQWFEAKPVYKNFGKNRCFHGLSVD